MPQQKTRRLNPRQIALLELCKSEPQHITRVKDEDLARRLCKWELLKRVKGPVPWRRYYVVTQAGLNMLLNWGEHGTLSSC